MVPSCDLQVIRVFGLSGYRKKRRSDINYHGGRVMKIKNVQRVIFLVFFFLFFNQAWAANWIYIDKAAVGDVYYGKNSIKKVDKSIILVWNKVILSKEAKTKYFSILKGINKEPQNPSMLSYYKKLIEIDCVNRKIKDNVITFYDEKGKVVYASPKSESGEWNDILPDTVGEKLIKIVSCEAVPPKEAAAPKVEEAIPSKEAAAPKVEEAVPPKEAAAPKVEEAVPPKEAAAPKVEEAVPPKEAAAPKVEEAVPPKEAAAPKVEEAVPSKEAGVTHSPLFAAYSGHVASFKSEDNAVKFVNKMKAKGLIAFYQKEDVSGQGAFYRLYIGRYKTLPLARKALTKLKKSGEINFFQIKKTEEKYGKVVTKEMDIGVQKNGPAQKQKNKTASSIDTRNYYKGINGIVLKDGKVVKGQIISVYDDVLKIRTKRGKILSYSFMKVKEYITQ
jgi:DedD protein